MDIGSRNWAKLVRVFIFVFAGPSPDPVAAGDPEIVPGLFLRIMYVVYTIYTTPRIMSNQLRALEFGGQILAAPRDN